MPTFKNYAYIKSTWYTRLGHMWIIIHATCWAHAKLSLFTQMIFLCVKIALKHMSIKFHSQVKPTLLYTMLSISTYNVRVYIINVSSQRPECVDVIFSAFPHTKDKLQTIGWSDAFWRIIPETKVAIASERNICKWMPQQKCNKQIGAASQSGLCGFNVKFDRIAAHRRGQKTKSALWSAGESPSSSSYQSWAIHHGTSRRYEDQVVPARFQRYSYIHTNYWSPRASWVAASHAMMIWHVRIMRARAITF